MRDYAFCNLLPVSELRGNKKYDVSGTAGSVPWPSPAWLLQPGTLISLSKGLFSFAPGSSTLAGYPEKIGDSKQGLENCNDEISGDPLCTGRRALN